MKGGTTATAYETLSLTYNGCSSCAPLTVPLQVFVGGTKRAPTNTLLNQPLTKLPNSEALCTEMLTLFGMRQSLGPVGGPAGGDSASNLLRSKQLAGLIRVMQSWYYWAPVAFT